MIYFIQDASSGPIKIGTTGTVAKRLNSLRCTENRPELQVLAVMPGRRREERSLHRQFDHCRLDGEWFEPAGDLLDFIRDSAKPWDRDAEDIVPIFINRELAIMLKTIAEDRNQEVWQAASTIAAEPARLAYIAVLKKISPGMFAEMGWE